MGQKWDAKNRTTSLHASAYLNSQQALLCFRNSLRFMKPLGYSRVHFTLSQARSIQTTSPHFSASKRPNLISSHNLLLRTQSYVLQSRFKQFYVRYSALCIMTGLTICKSDVWLTVHRNSVRKRKTNYMSLSVFFISLLIVVQHVSGNHVQLWNEPIHGRTTCQPVLTTSLQPRHIPTQGYNITQSSAQTMGT